MNKLILLLGVVLCAVAVTARHHGLRSEESIDSDDDLSRRDHTAPRHRRRRWQMNYRYDFPVYNYERRAEYENYQETIHNIYKMLEELTAIVRETRTPPPPPPPPQPIYIPYPVPITIPQRSCNKDNENKDAAANKTIDSRLNDENMYWGFVEEPEDIQEDFDNDGARPINFDPIIPKEVFARPLPDVDHGTVQSTLSTEAPKVNDAPAQLPQGSPPAMCNAAVLSCCGFSSSKERQKNCFANIGCAALAEGNNVCSEDAIAKALESFRAAYSPK